MKVAIMQPYFFPYIGYFQLLNSVDKFVIYDDVNYIKQGWINRNRIISNRKPLYFTVPIKNQSSYDLIKNTLIDKKQFIFWKDKFLRTLEYNYKKAPYFLPVFELVKYVVSSDFTVISQISSKSLLETVLYLGIETEMINSSEIYNNKNISSFDRIIDICKIEKATEYINLIGGQGLYSKNYFLENNLLLRFIRTNQFEYAQFGNEFFPNLSIIDVLMFNSVKEANLLLKNFHMI